MNSEINISLNNNKYIKELSLKYNDSKITLFLGAGFSMAANMPSWDELIAKFLITRFKDESKVRLENKTINDLMEIARLNSENSPISQTRFIKQNITPEKYLELLKEAIYQKNGEINIDNKLFESITELIRNENKIYIKDIITFNFDNLLEKKLKQKYIAYEQYTNYGEIKNKDYVNIYHVHGYLDEKATPDEVELDRIVFSEEQYHKMYNDVYNWSNIKQIYALKEKTCLFIGCSLSDPNMRRILDITCDRLGDAKHYAIMRKESLIIPDSINENSEAYELYQKFHIENKNSYFNSLGINVIWVDEYDDIPEIIQKIID